MLLFLRELDLRQDKHDVETHMVASCDFIITLLDLTYCNERLLTSYHLWYNPVQGFCALKGQINFCSLFLTKNSFLTLKSLSKHHLTCDTSLLYIDLFKVP